MKIKRAKKENICKKVKTNLSLKVEKGLLTNFEIKKPEEVEIMNK